MKKQKKNQFLTFKKFWTKKKPEAKTLIWFFFNATTTRACVCVHTLTAHYFRPQKAMSSVVGTHTHTQSRWEISATRVVLSQHPCAVITCCFLSLPPNNNNNNRTSPTTENRRKKKQQPPCSISYSVYCCVYNNKEQKYKQHLIIFIWCLKNKKKTWRGGKRILCVSRAREPLHIIWPERGVPQVCALSATKDRAVNLSA